MNQHHQAQWHNVIVKRKMEWEDGPDGRAVLLLPRFRWGPMAKWVQPRLKNPYIRVKLDDIGSFVWRNCDGVKTVLQIAEAMRQEFKEKAEPAEDRLQKFLIILQKSKFAELYQAVGA